MNKWLPKEERKKILLLSDDLRIHSGVGVMSREIVENTMGYFNWVQIGAALTHPESGKVIDVSDSFAEETGVEDPFVRIYPNNGYGNSRLLRRIMELEKPDAILHFTDPRYWIWLYQMEHELRQQVPIMYYNIWDDTPDPLYNRDYYRSCDALFSISKQTYGINTRVLGEEASSRTLRYIPHGVDHNKKFYPIPEDDSDGQDLLNKVRKETLRGQDIDFMVFYNSRNLHRKMTSDVLLAYDYFLKKLTPEEQERCRIVLHTTPVDENGTDLFAVLRDVVPNVKAIFSDSKIDSDVLNALYNLADVTISLSSNEGFGLGTCESIMAGTPIIVNVTGGLQDQCGFMDEDGNYLTEEVYANKDWGTNHDGRYKSHGEWSLPVFPVSRSLRGSPVTPYIFDDRASWEEAGDRLMELYKMGRDERKRRGLLGREYGMNEGMFTAEKMGELFITRIDEVFENWTPRERYTLVKG